VIDKLILKSECKMYNVGILALQGDFELHAQAVNKLEIEPILIKTAEELSLAKRLILPGGETTTMSKLIDLYNLRQSLIEFGKTKPIFGTCAGLVMLSMESGDPRVTPLKLINIDSDRNAYGRQVFSFSKEGEIYLGVESEMIEMVFIRAPKISRLGDDVQVLGMVDGEVVLARQNNILVSAFHPELTENTRILEYFLKI
jgi:pyridoxal 5'-phosphate synthase pdxT subunit